MGPDHTEWLDEETLEWIETLTSEWASEWTKEYRAEREAARAAGADEGALASEESFLTRKEIILIKESIFAAAGRAYGDKISIWETARKRK